MVMISLHVFWNVQYSRNQRIKFIHHTPLHEVIGTNGLIIDAFQNVWKDLILSCSFPGKMIMLLPQKGRGLVFWGKFCLWVANDSIDFVRLSEIQSAKQIKSYFLRFALPRKIQFMCRFPCVLENWLHFMARDIQSPFIS